MGRRNDVRRRDAKHPRPRACRGSSALLALLLVLAGSAPAGAEEQTHTVAQGETIFRIAKRYGTSVDDVIRTNRISDVRRVRAGTRLVIPGPDGQTLVTTSDDARSIPVRAGEPVLAEALPAPVAATPPKAKKEAPPPTPEPPAEPDPQTPTRTPRTAPPKARTLGPPLEPKPLPGPARSWVFGATDVSGPELGLMQVANVAGAPSTVHRPLKATPSTQTIDFQRPRNGDDVLHEIEIEQGKSVFLRTDYTIKRVSVGNPDIMDVVVLSPREIQLVAKQVGATNVILWDPSGRPQAAIDVHVGTVHSHLESVLRRVLDGEDIHVESAGAGIALSGSVSSAVAMDQALSVANAFLGDDDRQVVNLLDLEGNQQVMLKVVVAEMSRTLERQLGTNFAALIETGGKEIAIVSLLEGLSQFGNGGGITGSAAANLLGSFTNLGSVSLLQIFLSFVEKEGLGKILAQPTLVARSGETASFLVGGEVPIPIAQGGAFGSITVDYKDFGVGVGFTPTVLGPDRIHLEVSPEVSEIDFGIGTEVDGTVVPGFKTRRSSTSIELGDGQSFAIAGLLSEVLREVAAEYPVLGRIPVLGALFRSAQFQRNETELVIIVTPQLVKPLGPGPHPLPTEAFIEPTGAEFYLLGALEGWKMFHPEEEPLPEESSALIGDVGWRIPATPQGGDL
jgi:pilus assembly protein CpaC